MPYDRLGNELKEGDTVTLTARVKELFPGEGTACNVTLEVDGQANECCPAITCNSKLCERTGDSDLTKAARQGFGS